MWCTCIITAGVCILTFLSSNISGIENEGNALCKPLHQKTLLNGLCLQLLFAESFSRTLHPSPIMALGDWAFYLSTASSHLPWKSRLFPPYASMFCQASLVCSAPSKFHYGMAGSTLCCSLRLSAWHVTVCNTRNAGGLNTPSTEDCLTTFAIAWRLLRIKDLVTHGCINPTGILIFFFFFFNVC